MAGYLDEYGVTDARRERLRKRIIIWGVLALIIGTSAFFYFRNWGEERALDRFVTLLKQQKYQEAYEQWLERPQNGETMVTYDLTGDGTQTLDDEQEK